MAPTDYGVNPDDAAKFRQLFWPARRAHALRQTDATSDDPDCRAALEFARSRDWPWAEAMLEASRLDRAGEHRKATELLSGYAGSIPDEFDDLLHFLFGGIWAAQGNYDKAVESYRRALADPRFDKPAYGWSNLGAALSQMGEFDEAITAFRKAIAEPTYDTPGFALNNLGIAFYKKGEYDQAVSAIRESIDDPSYLKKGKAWENLGLAYAAKGAYDEAIDAFRQALDARHPNPASVWTNLAHAYSSRNLRTEAIDAFSRALASPDKGSEHAQARLGLSLLEGKIAPAALSADDRALAVTGRVTAGDPADSIEAPIIAAIHAAGDTQYQKYIAKADSQRDDTLSILRGWSSAVTLLEGSERRWRGGGYFLKWRGYGIVIDPGFDFLRNFHDAAYHGREIHAVVVSHNHPDHNSDLKVIDDLRYELFKRLAPTPGGGVPYVLLWDQDTYNATTFGFEKPQHQYEPVVMAAGFPQTINLLEHEAAIPVAITPFKVKHGDDVPYAMGMVIELLDPSGEPALRIGYTGDTEYFSDLHTHFADCDVLIAHISQPSIEELQDATKVKDVHLGYRGTARLLKECRPRLALIGEFWAGLTDLRIPLAKGLRQRSGIEAVLPVGLALHLRLPTLQVECTECAKPSPFSEVIVAPPTSRFGNLAYLCRSCVIG